MVSAVWGGVRWGHSEGQKTLNVKNFVYLRICVKTYSRTRALESIVRFMQGATSVLCVHSVTIR